MSIKNVTIDIGSDPEGGKTHEVSFFVSLRASLGKIYDFSATKYVYKTMFLLIEILFFDTINRNIKRGWFKSPKPQRD